MNAINTNTNTPSEEQVRQHLLAVLAEPVEFFLYPDTTDLSPVKYAGIGDVEHEVARRLNVSNTDDTFSKTFYKVYYKL